MEKVKETLKMARAPRACLSDTSRRAWGPFPWGADRSRRQNGELDAGLHRMVEGASGARLRRGGGSTGPTGSRASDDVPAEGPVHSAVEVAQGMEDALQDDRGGGDESGERSRRQEQQ
ncbi:unnamed protein product [Prorocentrum cordatum]|uniref:Uncharacterized protein n=1 Tax=Prorocentrum cordatum TaxID=2364126 RepID=A0ABN9P6X3_9DINO|nr:unnamed protein product [Polarella glacialis]